MVFFTSTGEAYSFATSILMGMTMVIGVSALIAAPSYMSNYYRYILGDENAEPKHTKFWQVVLTVYSVVTMVTQTVFGPLNLTTFCCRLSLVFRLLVSSLLMLLELLVVLLIPTSSKTSEMTTIISLIFLAFVGGFARAFYENTGYALFGPFPQKMISGLVIGSAVCGAFMSFLQIVIKILMSEDFESVKDQLYIYFSIALFIIVTSTAMMMSLSRSSFARMYISEFRTQDGFFANIYRKRRSPGFTAPYDAGNYAGDECLKSDHAGDGVSPVQENDCAEPTTAELLQETKLWPIIKLIYPMQFACFFTYFSTYLVFPGVMLAVDYDNEWYGTIVMAVFNVMDLVGRLLSLLKKLWPPRRWVVIAAFLRILLIPILILCATHLIPTHMAAYVVTGVTGITNGFLATRSVAYAPATEGLTTAGERALAGQATGVALLFGVSLGSLLQLALVLLL